MSEKSKAARRALVCEVVSNEKTAQGTYHMVVKAPEAFFDEFVPGQFAHIEVPGAPQLLLRRPLCVYSADRERGEVAFVYAVRGQGTQMFTHVRPGDHVDSLMPLGNGFQIENGMKRIWLLGGGLGTAAVGSLPGWYKDLRFRLFLGFRGSGYVFGEELAADANVLSVEIATDDGTKGTKGLVTDMAAAYLDTERPDAIFACGPEGMFRALAGDAFSGIPIRICVEERMGCGTGGCETCVFKVRGKYVRSCTDGPVFDLGEVDEYVG